MAQAVARLTEELVEESLAEEAVKRATGTRVVLLMQEEFVWQLTHGFNIWMTNLQYVEGILLAQRAATYSFTLGTTSAAQDCEAQSRTPNAKSCCLQRQALSWEAQPKPFAMTVFTQEIYRRVS